MPSAARRTRGTPVYLEIGQKRVFACSLDWPGWCRSAKDEQGALEAMAAYAPRYAEVAGVAGVRFPKGAGDSFEIVDRVKGDATTDFGAPHISPEADQEPLTKAASARAARLVQAAWQVFDDVVANAPAQLRKGPRGGGRDRDKIVDHVLGAEAAYARKIEVRHRQPDAGDDAAIEAMREDIAATLEASRGGPPATEKGWTARYAARRIAWHVLDHAWEIQDRSETSKD